MRSKLTRTRTGCLTCRKRRKKCDEQKPRCTGCIRNCLSCSWPLPKVESSSTSTSETSGSQSPEIVEYNPLIEVEDINSPTKMFADGTTKSMKQADLVLRNRPNLSHLEAVKQAIKQVGSISISPGSAMSIEQLGHFAYFQSRILPGLEGYFPSDFWGGLLLQLAQSEGSISHGISAVALCYQEFQGNRVVNIADPDPKDAIILGHYSRAIKDLNARISSNENIHVVLTFCLLFYTLECIRGCPTTAIAHLRGGLQVLNEERARQLSRSAQDREHLSHIDSDLYLMFSRTEINIETYSFTLPEGNYSVLQKEPPELDPNIPLRFAALYEARVSQNVMEQHVFKLITKHSNSGDEMDQARCRKLLTALMKWRFAFQELLNTNANSKLNYSDRDQQQIHFMMLHYHAMKALLQTTTPFGPLKLRGSTTDFEGILYHAGGLIDLLHKDSDKDNPLPVFIVTSGIVGSLWYIATRTYHTSIRDAAIDLLSRAKVREAIWDSDITAKVAKRMIASSTQSFGEFCEPIPEAFLSFSSLVEKYYP